MTIILQLICDYRFGLSLQSALLIVAIINGREIAIGYSTRALITTPLDKLNNLGLSHSTIGQTCTFTIRTHAFARHALPLQ